MTPGSRRSLMMGMAGGLALMGGFAAWWRRKGSDPAQADPVLRELWSLSLPTPEGGTLALASMAGRPLLINFWATWCPPCIEELPLIDDFYRKNVAKGWQVIGIAADNAAAVKTFLGRMPLSFPVAMAGLDGIELSRKLGNLSGGLPFSVLLSKSGAVAQRKMGKLAAADLAAWRQID